MAKKRGRKRYSLVLMIILAVFFACLFAGGITFYIVYAPEQFRDYNQQTSQYSEGTIFEGTKTGVIVSENKEPLFLIKSYGEYEYIGKQLNPEDNLLLCSIDAVLETAQCITTKELAGTVPGVTPQTIIFAGVNIGEPSSEKIRELLKTLCEWSTGKQCAKPEGVKMPELFFNTEKKNYAAGEAVRISSKEEKKEVKEIKEEKPVSVFSGMALSSVRKNGTTEYYTFSNDRQNVFNVALEKPKEQANSFSHDLIIDAAGESISIARKGGEVTEMALSTDGYIVEFKEPPLLQKQAELEISAAANQEYIDSSAWYNPLKYTTALFAVMPDDVQRNVDAQKAVLFNEHKNALIDFCRTNAVPEACAAVNSKTQMPGEFSKVFNGIYLDVSKETAELVKKSRYVEKIYPNKKVEAFLNESVPMIGADKIWDLTDEQGNKITGKGIKIAIIDTGIDYTHPDLGGCFGQGCRVEGGYDFISDDEDPMDDHGHGTHCAGIAAANGALKGVAPDATLYAYKVLDSGGSGSWESVIAGIERAVDPNQDGDFSDGADVISLSLGGGGDPDDPVSQAVDNAVNSGVVAAVAAGNSGPMTESIGSPGTARKAITVGASCKPSQIGVNSYCDDALATFSSRGPVVWSGGTIIKPDIVAPGVAICSAQWDSAWEENKCFDENHVAISGTSMATPHIAGVSALLLQSHPDWSPEDVKSALMMTAEDIGYQAIAQGAGQVNAIKANDIQILISPLTIEFGSFVTADSASKEFIIKNMKDSPVEVVLSATSATDDKGNSYDVVSLDRTNAVIPAKSSEVFTASLNLLAEMSGNFVGTIEIQAGEEKYSITYVFNKLSEITLVAEGNGGEMLYPGFYIHDNSITFARFIMPNEVRGDSYTLKVPSGNYTVYAIGNDWGKGDTSLEYILMASVSVAANDRVKAVLRLSDARPFTIKAHSVDGRPLSLNEWQKGFVTYSENTAYSTSWTDPVIGDRIVYVTNKPDNGLDTDIIFKYSGVPYEKK